MVQLQVHAFGFWSRTKITTSVDLEQKGFKVNRGPGMLSALLPSGAKDRKSPYANKKVRQAIEYAIDRPAVARMLGSGSTIKGGV